MADFEIANGPVRLRVDGLNKTVRDLGKAGADAQDLRQLMQDIGQIVVGAASPPSRTGRLAGTIRAGKGKTKSVIRAGGARAPYAGVTHYGWPARGIAPNPFLTDAISSRRSQILDALDDGIQDIMRKNDLL